LWGQLEETMNKAFEDKLRGQLYWQLWGQLWEQLCWGLDA